MGTRALELEPIYENKSKIHLIWDFEFSGGPNTSIGLGEGDLKQATVDAVKRITHTAERLIF